MRHSDYARTYPHERSISIAEQMDVDYIVLGRYDYDGQQFRAHAQLLDMKALHLSRRADRVRPSAQHGRNSGRAGLGPSSPGKMSDLPAKTSFVAASTPVRLDAFENYIRGMIAISRQEKIKHFHDAIRLDPGYYEAMLQLGHTHYDNREYDPAASWFGRVPRSSPYGNEAAFFYGLSEYYLGDYAKSEEAFQYLSGTLPLTEVYNNFAVAAGHRGKHAEIDYLQKAVTADPSDPDYHFNLAVAYYRAGQTTAASRQLKEVLNLRPSDSEAKSFTRQPLSSVDNRVSRVPLQRIKLNYDETSYKQLAMEIQKANELRLAQADPHTRAEFHVDRAKRTPETWSGGRSREGIRGSRQSRPIRRRCSRRTGCFARDLRSGESRLGGPCGSPTEALRRCLFGTRTHSFGAK